MCRALVVGCTYFALWLQKEWGVRIGLFCHELRFLHLPGEDPPGKPLACSSGLLSTGCFGYGGLLFGATWLSRQWVRGPDLFGWTRAALRPLPLGLWLRCTSSMTGAVQRT